MPVRLLATSSLILVICIALWVPLSQATQKPVAEFCVPLLYSPVNMYKRYQPFCDYLTQHTPYRFELRICRNNKDAMHCLKRGKLQMALLEDIAFINAHDSIAAVPILKPLNDNGRPFVRSAIIVATNSPIRTVQDLKGRSFAFGPTHSIPGNLSARYFLFKRGVRLNDLSAHATMKSNAEVIKAVLGREWEAGAVIDSIAEQYAPQGIRILAYSDPIPSSPIVVRADAPPRFVQAVVTALLRLDRSDARHRSTMANWDRGIGNGFSPASATDYRDLFRIYHAIPSGCGRGCHR